MAKLFLTLFFIFWLPHLSHFIFPCLMSREICTFMRQNIEDPDIAACAERMTITKDDKKTLYLWTFLPEPCTQPRSQGLSSLPPLVVGTETLMAAGHVTTQNLGGRKICWKGGVFYRLLNQMYLSTHPPCGFGWIDGHMTSRNQGLCSND